VHDLIRYPECLAFALCSNYLDEYFRRGGRLRSVRYLGILSIALCSAATFKFVILVNHSRDNLSRQQDDIPSSLEPP
jgi:hypothetical protein